MQLLIDVRTVPRSRTNPQYNFDILGDNLAPWQIAYDRIAELGGLRGKTPGVDPSVNAFWNNQSFHNYADYALGEPFAAGLERLLELSAERPTAIMCSEAVWWRCHRRLVADYLMLRGRTVNHLMGGGRTTPASMTPGARQRGDHLVYPPQAEASA